MPEPVFFVEQQLGCCHAKKGQGLTPSGHEEMDSPPLAFVSSKRLFPQTGDQVTLVPLPVIPWHRLAPGLVALEGIEDPWQAVEQARRLALDERLAEARRFVEEHLTEAERRVVALLVREGVSDKDLATRLVMSEKTVGNHLYSVYAKAAAFWGVQRISRGQLIALLHLYFVARPLRN